MSDKKIIFIDVREENEVSDKSIVSKNDNDVVVFNIPMRNIFGNVMSINKLSETSDLVYIICRSGVRSKQIIDKYFPISLNIKSFEGGINKLKEDPSSYNVEIKESDNFIRSFNTQQYMQIVFVLILSTIVYLLYSNVIENRFIMYGLLVMIAMILYQLISGNCMLTSMIPLK